jgi:DNA-binding transcriptional LysR family regulator
MAMAPLPKLRDLNKLSVFAHVAERLSFTRAAADLKTRPSVVSKHISELENSLGFSLMHRSTHGVVLTDAGEKLFKTCLQMFADFDAFVVETRNSQTGPYGSLHILASGGYAQWALGPLISRFLRRHPHLHVKLSAESADVNAMEEGCDVIVAGRRPPIPGLVERDIGEISHVVCASPAYFRQFGKPKKPRDLHNHNCLANMSSGLKEWPFQQAGHRISVEVKGVMSSNSSALLVRAALDGVGVVRVPHYAAAAALASGDLETIFEHISLSPERLRAYFSKSKHLPAKILDFVDFLQTSIGTATVV